jgi:hypothetical protein
LRNNQEIDFYKVLVRMNLSTSSATDIAPRLLLCMAASEQASILTAIGQSAQFDIRHIKQGWQSLLNGLLDQIVDRPTVMVLDLDEINQAQLDLHAICQHIAGEGIALKLVVSAGRLPCLSTAQIGWAHQWGVAALLPSLAMVRLDNVLRSSTGRQLHKLFGDIDLTQVQAQLKPTMQGVGRSAELIAAHQALAQLEKRHTTLEHVEQWARSRAGFATADRTLHMQRYVNCFVASEAVDALAARFCIDRVAARTICQMLQSSGVIDHVTYEHTFIDSDLFYRFSNSEVTSLVSLAEVFAVLKADVRRLDRRYFGKTHKQTFLGAEAADVVAKHYAVTHDTAVSWVEQLATLGLLCHVTGEQRFRPNDNFYQFCGLGAPLVRQSAYDEFEFRVPVFT